MGGKCSISQKGRVLSSTECNYEHLVIKKTQRLSAVNTLGFSTNVCCAVLCIRMLDHLEYLVVPIHSHRNLSVPPGRLYVDLQLFGYTDSFLN